MRKFIIFFIIMVSIMTFCLIRPNKINKENVVTDAELNEYRNSLIAGFEKYGYHLTDEELNQKVEEYKEMQINIAESRSKSMDTKQAFKTSLIVCSICCVILFVIFHLKNAQYNELFGNSFGSNNINDNMKGLRRFFFGRWF